jgi:hypothetical protein
MAKPVEKNNLYRIKYTNTQKKRGDMKDGKMSIVFSQ